MEVIVPAAGLSTRFPGMKPKYLLYDYKHELMVGNAIRPYLRENIKVTIGILKEHDEKYNASQFLKHEFGNTLNIVILDNPTKGPADTVYQILSNMEINFDESILIKDCDSFFEHDYTADNYICVSKISEHEVLKKLSSKSFVISNEQGIIKDIIEKSVVSDTFCVGGYKFQSAALYMNTFEQISHQGELFVSDVIGRCINDGIIFSEKKVNNYFDVGTAQDWFEYNNKPVIFCDIDGTIIKAQSRLDLVGGESYEPLTENIQRLLKQQDLGAQIFFVTAREPQFRAETRQMLYELGFMSFGYIDGLQNSNRILINDYNNANPYPRASAINLKRDSDNLGDFL
jgi:dTDP-glucose pyrophosphorylase